MTIGFTFFWTIFVNSDQSDELSVWMTPKYNVELSSVLCQHHLKTKPIYTL